LPVRLRMKRNPCATVASAEAALALRATLQLWRVPDPPELPPTPACATSTTASRRASDPRPLGGGQGAARSRSRRRGGVSCREGGQGIDAIFAWSRWSQRMPGGRRPRRHRMTWSTATIRSRRKSWAVSGSARGTSWRGWTVVTSTVSWPSSPASASRPNSRSEYPPPLPTRAPWRLTATLPQTTSSTGRSWSTPAGRPTRAAPLMEAARRGGRSRRRGSRTMKGRSAVSRGTAMYTSLPSARALALTGSWGASGLALMTWAACHSGSEASRSAATSAPAKFGILPVAPGNRATRSFSSRAQTRSRTACLARAVSGAARVTTTCPIGPCQAGPRAARAARSG
jgi:hypothetical protein